MLPLQLLIDANLIYGIEANMSIKNHLFLFHKSSSDVNFFWTINALSIHHQTFINMRPTSQTKLC